MTTLTETREHPILFSSEMIRAILAGTKSQTRRVIKPQPEERTGQYGEQGLIWQNGKGGMRAGKRDWVIEGMLGFGPYQPGMTLWVRETWKERPNTAGVELHGPDDMGAIFRATWDKSGGHHWKPSIFMPRWASRITLEITDVRVERVQEISTADACAEGVSGCRDHLNNVHAVTMFQALWDSINLKRGYSWDDNPFCWCISFRRIAP